MNVKEKVKGFALKQLYDYLDSDPDKNIPKILDLLERSDKSGAAVTSQVNGIRKALADPTATGTS